MNRSKPSVRLTHKPTGETVLIRTDRDVRLPEAERHARALLLARLCRPAEAPRSVRSYTFNPEYAAGITQGGQWIAKGVPTCHESTSARATTEITVS